MRRREFIAAAGTAALGRRQPATAAPNKPDIVVIVTDDMRDSDWQALPKTKQLLADGTVFPNYFTTTPLCCPSRSSMLTGLYAHNHGVRTNYLPQRGASVVRKVGEVEQTVAVWLQAAGYYSGLVGKYLNGYQGHQPAPGWNVWNAVDDKPKYVMDGEYSTTLFQEQAVSFIDSAPPNLPLFLWFAPKAPHNPATPDTPYRHAFANAAVPNGSPHLNRLERRRLETLSSVDDAVAAIADAMGSRWNNACVFVVSDNGWMMGEHGVVGKALPYDGAVRISMRARIPGVRKPSDDRLVANIDLAPTIADVANVSTPDSIDGRSLRDGTSRDAILLEGWSKKDKTPTFVGARIMDAVNKDALYWERKGKKRYFFDRTKDPGERDNVVHDPAYATQVEAARQHLELLQGCQGDSCRTADVAGASANGA